MVEKKEGSGKIGKREEKGELCDGFYVRKRISITEKKHERASERNRRRGGKHE